MTVQVHATEEPFAIEVDGRAIGVLPGQTVAAALLAAGLRAWRYTPSGAPRGLFCGMGVCFDCLVTIDGLPERRACMTQARPGMRVRLASGPEGNEGGAGHAGD